MHSRMPDEVTSVLVTGSVAELAQTVQARHHKIIADEPIEAGGRDTGPSPYELLLSALGT